MGERASKGPAFLSGADVDLPEEIADVLRQKIEDAFRAVEARFRALLEHATDTITVVDCQGNMAFKSPPSVPFAGYKADDLMGDDIFSYIHPEDLPKVVEAFEAVRAEGGSVRTVEFRVLYKDGSFGILESTAKNLLDDPIIAGIVVNSRNISARRLAECALRESEERLRLITDNMLDLVSQVNTEGVVQYASPSHLEVLGLRPEELVGRPVFDFMHPDDVESLRRDFAEVLAGRPARKRAIRIVSAHDRYRWLEVAPSVIYDQKGDPAGFIYSSRDVTERQQAEQALRESENRYHALFEHSSAATAICRGDTTILQVNTEFENLFGYHRSEIQGHTWARVVHPDDLGVVTECYLRRRESQAVSPEAHEIRCVRVDGEIVNALVTSGMIPGTDQWVASLLDITKLKQAQEALLQSREELRQAHKMDALGRLAGGVAHDFNNLLIVISGYSSLLAGRLDPSDPAHFDALEIKNAADRAAAFTRQLLTFSRRQPTRPRVLDLNQTLLDMEAMLGRLIGEDIELIIDLNPDLHQTSADPGQIEQVILNLAANARDSMYMGGRLTLKTDNVRVEETVEGGRLSLSPGEYVLLEAMDTGEGMDEETRTQALEPFFTTKPFDKGTGLGLSVVYGIVEQARGGIELESAPGLGTCARVYLPRATPATDREPVPLEPAGSPEHLNGDETVLIVEDEEAVRRFLVSLLEDYGYTVLEAGWPGGALEVMESNPSRVDVLVTDVVMPGMGGQRLARILRERDPGLKIIFISGYTDDAELVSGVSGEDFRLLEKPFEPEALVQAIRRLLDGGRDS